MGEALERQLAPVGDVLVEAASLGPGERVLDVGCGLGPTTRAAAAAVGGSGAVTGLDISTEMLDAAASAAAISASGTGSSDSGALGAESAQILWTAADATSWDAPPDSFDVVISRFGVMFFDDPEKAFTNLARLTAPGGRLCVVVWARRDRCDMFEVPLQAVLRHLGSFGLSPQVPIPPADGGPFSLSDAQHVSALLVRSGWIEPAISTRRLAFPLGGGVDALAASRAALELGPARAVLEGQGDDVVEGARRAVEDALSGYVKDGSVVLDGEVLVVTAER